jgi:hypothetical protein
MNLTNLNKKGYNSASKASVNYDIPTEIEFWDNQGNYFRKPVLMSGQGKSSMGYKKKNISLDIYDTTEDRDNDENGFGIKFGNWVVQNSFHLKAFVSDFAKGLSFIGYKIAEEVSNTRGIMNNTPYKRYINSKYQYTGNLYADPQIDDLNI